MLNVQQIQIDGEVITFGECNDRRYPGKCFVSIGSRYNHTTFIVDEFYASIRAIRVRGADKHLWRKVAIAVTIGYWG